MIKYYFKNKRNNASAKCSADTLDCDSGFRDQL